MTDVGDEVQVTKKRETKKSTRDIYYEDVRKLLATYEGRHFYWTLLSQCNMYKPSYVQGDTHATAANEGKRMIGLWAMNEIASSSSSMYDKMRLEAEERERKNG